MDKETNRFSESRRTILQSISAAGVSLTGLSGAVVATEKERDVSKIQGTERRKLISQILSSDDVRSLRSRLDESVRPEIEKSRVFRVTETDESGEKMQYRVATVQFSRGENNLHTDETGKSIFLTWNDKADDSLPESVITTLDTANRTQTRLSLGRGSVTEEKVDLENPRSNDSISDSDFTAQAVGDPEECVSYISDECTNTNWSCVAELGLAYAACGTAVIKGGWVGVLLCLLEGGVHIWQVADDENCSLCDSSELREVEICGAPSSSP